LNLKELLNEFKKHRMNVIRRRTRYLLRKAELRLHIVDGLLKALDHIDAIIALIRASHTVDEAQAGLMSRFGFTEIQAREILNMRLQRLTGLERTKLLDEAAKLRAEIEDYRAILASERRVLEIIITELKEIQERYGDDRRTEIVEEVGEFIPEDLITQEKVAVTFSHEGYVKRTPLGTYRSQGRGGKGITGGATKTGDFIRDLFVASTHDYILLFTNRGWVYWLRVYDIPDLGRTSKGRALINMVSLKPEESVTGVLCVDGFDEMRQVLQATKQGVIKKTPLSAFSNPKKGGIIALTLDDGDTLIGSALCVVGQEVILGTRNGMAIRFRESDVRSMGRTARGVGGISLRDGDEVVDMVVVDAAKPGEEPPPVEDGEEGSTGSSEDSPDAGSEGSAEAAGAAEAPVAEGSEPAGPEGEEEAPAMAGVPTLLTVCENGYGKRTPISAYRLQNRNGHGTINIKTTDRNGKVVGLKAVVDGDHIVLITSQGQVMRMPVASLRAIGRATQGVRVIKLYEGDRLVSVERVAAGEAEAGVAEGDGVEPGADGEGLSAGEPSGEAGGSDGAEGGSAGGEETTEG
jgi:DNA gyrase/topoisomerase IV subunit A